MDERIDGRMGEETGGKGFESIVEHLILLPQVFHHGLQPGIVPQGLEIPFLSLDDVGGAGEAPLGQDRREDSVKGRFSGMERLGHGPEDQPQPGRLGPGQAHGLLHLPQVESQELSRSHGRAEPAEGGRGVPAPVVMFHSHALADPGLHLKAGDESLQGRFPGNPFPLGHGQEGRDQGGAGMTHPPHMGVIVIQGVGHGPVDQGRLGDTGLHPVAPDRGLGISPEFPDGLQEDFGQGLTGPSQCYADEIQETALGLVDHFPGERPVGRLQGITRQGFGNLHDSLPLSDEIPDAKNHDLVKSHLGRHAGESRGPSRQGRD